MKRRTVLLATAAALVAALLGFSSQLARPQVATSEPRPALLSASYRLDRIYHSMEGPFSIQKAIRVDAASSCPVQWLTGVDTEVVDAANETRTSQEFFCHSNLTFSEAGPSPARYNHRAGGETHLDWRLFTLVPGRLSIELPKGFGIPVPAAAKLDYVTMSLNLNVKDKVTDVRMRTRLHTVAGDQPDAPSKALFRRALYVLQPQTQAAAVHGSGMNDSAPHHVGAGCADFCRVNFSAVSTVGALGQGHTLHWLVPPGRHTYVTEITPQLNLPFDTTIHYATIHVHPFAKSMELRDLTTGQTVLRLSSRDWSDRLGVAHVDELKSASGIPIFRTHRYQLIADYDNNSEEVTDAMAILYLYLLENKLT